MIKKAKPFGTGGCHITLPVSKSGQEFIVLPAKYYKEIKKILEQIDRQKEKPLGKVLNKKELERVKKDIKEAERKLWLNYTNAPIKHSLIFCYSNLEEITSNSDKQNVANYCTDKKIKKKIENSITED